MLTKFIIQFVQYLNKNDYNISIDKIFNFFEILSQEEIKFSNKQDIISLMKIVFCINRTQVLNLENYFDVYCDNFQKKKLSQELKEEKKNNKDNYVQKNKEQMLLLSNIDKEIQSKIKNIDITNDISNLFTNDEKAFIDENQERIKKIKLSNKKAENFLKECIIQYNNSKYNEYSINFVKNVSAELVKNSEQLLRKNKVSEFCFIKEVYDLVHKIEGFYLKENKIKEQKIDEITKDLQLEKEKIKQDILNNENQYKKIQNNIDKKLKQVSPTLVKKQESIHNREDFIGGTRSVQLTNNKKVQEYLDKKFSSLSKNEMNILYSYIKKNILSFKTKMNRNIYSENKNILNMQQTIQNACKTGGLPLNLFYQEKKKNKTNLVLILDVSGSCSSASEMMLSFMYLLKDVFSGGCKTFAFVDDLYDISDIMKSNNIKKSISTILNTIPRKGVYSNYYKPLQSLWISHKKILTKDTIVIFMGDARNNQNNKGLDYLKNISRKVKSCYWLNTEEFEKWGKADSLAFDYLKYTKMYEVLNTVELIHFINNFH